MEKIEKSTTIFRDFNIPLSAIDKKVGKHPERI